MHAVNKSTRCTAHHACRKTHPLHCWKVRSTSHVGKIRARADGAGVGTRWGFYGTSNGARLRKIYSHVSHDQQIVGHTSSMRASKRTLPPVNKKRESVRQNSRVLLEKGLATRLVDWLADQ